MGIRNGMRASILASALAAGTALGLAACGGSAAKAGAEAASPSVSAAGQHRSAAQLVSQMKAAVRGASSMHMSGQLFNAGKSTTLDLGVLRSGGLSGTITQNGVPLHLVGARGQVYVKATGDFLRELHAPSQVCSLICGKYVQMTGPQGGELRASLNMSSLTQSLLGRLPAFREDGSVTVGGQPALVLRAADGSVLDVAAHGKPYPLRVVSAPPRRETVLFSQWNAVPTPAPPPAGQVINLNNLKAGSS